MKRIPRRTMMVFSGFMAVSVMVSRPAAADVNLVTNGGFELNMSGGMSAPGSFFGWTQAGDTGATFVTTGSDGFSPHSGQYFALLGPVSPGSLSEGVATTLATTVGQTYTFSWWLGSDGVPPNSFQATWNGNVIFGQSSLPSTSGGYNNYSFTEMATSTTTPIQFTFSDRFGFLALDDVSVVANANPSAVPEPSTALFGVVGGLSMAGYMSWRSRRRTTP
jgi:hypothetical protein